MIEFNAKNCYLCNGSGYTTPFPYRSQKRCDHEWSKESWDGVLQDAKEEYLKAKQHYEKLKSIDKDAIKINRFNIHEKKMEI